LIVLPTVIVGGVSVLTLLVHDPEYAENPLRQDLWRAGHAHAGVLLVLSLPVLRYLDEAALSPHWRGFVRYAVPAAAFLLSAAFFLSVLSPRPPSRTADLSRPPRRGLAGGRLAGARGRSGRAPAGRRT
jgi:hypothetical protein